MADQNIMHSAEIMKAALPFINSKSRATAEFFTKILDLMGSMNAMSGLNSMAACGNEDGKADVEGMLTGIRPLCNNKEREIIDRILSIFNAKRMFEMYNNFMSVMKTMQEFGGSPFGDSDSGNNSDSFMNNFAGFNFDSIFGNSGSKSSDEPEPESENTTSEHFDGFDQNEKADSSSDTGPSSYSGSTGSNKMLDMLKAMIPPEQMSTFENLSMLLNTMSYDNNSKPDDSKECNDG